jgi:hypothetical protein
MTASDASCSSCKLGLAEAAAFSPIDSPWMSEFDGECDAHYQMLGYGEEFTSMASDLRILRVA